MLRVLAFPAILGLSAALPAAVLAGGDLKDRLASAGSVCLVPIEPKPLVATLAVSRRTLGDPMTSASDHRLRQTLAEAGEFEALNKRALALLEAAAPGKVRLADPRFRVEKKVLFAKVQAWDLEALDCDLYALAELERPGQDREAAYTVSHGDLKDEASYIPVLMPALSLTLYDKEKPGKKGKKVLSSVVYLVGKHSAEYFPGRKLSDVIAERVEAQLAGREPATALETDYFPWSKGPYLDSPETLARGFELHAEILRPRVRKRLEEMLADFEKALQKKLK